MKLSINALALASMAGFASATQIFDPPIPFIQYDGNCDGDVIYTGGVVSINKLEEGSFCIADIIEDTEGNTETAYSRVDVVSCTDDKIYEDWHSCDTDCVTCESEYQAYTNWESTSPDELVGFCFDYFFSLDDITVATTRSFQDVKQINFAFADDAEPEDVKAYLAMMDENSCIAAGSPAVEISKGTDTTDVPDDVADVDADAGESGASTLAATAAVAMAAATTMLLA